MNAALFTVAILASLSLTIWSADTPSAATAAGDPVVDASSPPHPTATTSNASTRSRTAPRLEIKARIRILLLSC